MIIRSLILFIVCPLLTTAQLKGKVIAISDGDTFTLLTPENEQIRIRLHGIDCPEKGQDYGQVAKKFLADLIYGKTVAVLKMDVDKYGRTIGMVKIDTVNVNETLLKEGLAWHYKRYDNSPKWAQLEEKARITKKGLWAMTGAVAPWEYRKKPND